MLPVSALQGIKVYNLSAGKTLPQWLEDAHKKKMSLRYNFDFRSRIELIQDFSFPTASFKIEASPDGKYLLASGTYPPQVKVFEVDQLAMKCERHIDAEAIAIEVLSEDYSKLALLRSDRCVEFHAKFGHYHKTRLPKICRDMTYYPNTCDLFIGGSTPIVYRLNLDQGRMLAPLETQLTGINSVIRNPVHSLLGFGGENASMEFWDPRDRTRASSLYIPNHTDDLGQILMGCEVTTSEYDIDGLTLGVGTSTGHVLIYDLRSSKPLFIKDFRNNSAIKDIKFHSSARKVVAADGNSIKLWDRDSGDSLTSIQPDGKVNSLCLFQQSGMILAALEQQRIGAYYVPALGVAPKWCSFLDNLTEELEESKATANIYEDYKFLTLVELQELNLTHLIGSQMLRAYMHGYFIDIRLYNKVKAAADPFAYENYVKDRIKKKIDEKRANRIVVPKKLPKVNKEYAQVLIEDSNAIAEKLNPSQNNENMANDETYKNPLKDSRFEKLFADDRFQIDTFSSDYQRVHPTKSSSQKANEISSRFDLVDDEDVEVDENVDSDEDMRSATKDKLSRVRQLVQDKQDSSRRKESQTKTELRDIEADIRAAEEKLSLKRKKPAMYELKQGFGASFDSVGNQNNKTSESFEDQLKAKITKPNETLSFQPVSKSSLPTRESDVLRRDRRGMKDILRDLPDNDNESEFHRGRGRGRGDSRGRGESRGRGRGDSGSRGSSFRGRGGTSNRGGSFRGGNSRGRGGFRGRGQSRGRGSH